MSRNILGIDIAKATVEVALLQDEGRPRHHQIANAPEGFADLQRWLQVNRAGEVHACLEATSTYGLALATVLYQAGHTVSIVNPYQVKAFAQSELRRTKTDRVDAALLARFCRAHRPQPWQPPDPALAALQALARRLDTLKDMRTQERNRLQVPGLLDAVQHSIHVVLAALEQEIAAIERQLEEHTAQTGTLQSHLALLMSIPGVGKTTATVLLSELGDITVFRNARAVAAYAGLVPTDRLSGTSVRGKPHLSKRGNARLRAALYWPAITARRCNPRFRAFVERQQAAGVHRMVTIAALMRRLLHLAYGILKSQRPFDPNYQVSKP